MTLLLRCVIAAVLATLFASTPARAAITVTYSEAQQPQPAPAPPLPDTGITITGDDLVNEIDEVTISTDGGRLVITRTGGGIILNAAPENCTVLVGGGVSCLVPRSVSIDLKGGNDKLKTVAVAVPLAIAGGAGDDDLEGGSANDVLAGGADTDTLNGREGIDEYFGETGGDIILSRDTVPERISCGEGDDRVDNDFTDIIAECERGTDTDRDGFSTAVDCDDGRANVFPGAPDPVENGIDEDCDGQDDRNLDRDGDAFPVPLDCNDADPLIRPGTLEIRGNAIDENCDQRALPFAPLASLVSTKWRLTSSTTRLRKLIVRNAPANARVTVTCKGKGCRFDRAKRVRVRRDLAPVKLHPFFGKGRLRPGARVVVTITADGTIGRRYRYDIVRNVLPAAAITCLVPGAKKATRC